MRILMLLTALVILCASCGTNYKIEELYGTWECEAMGFTFNQDGSCDIMMKGERWPGKTEFRAVSIGNTLEFTQGGLVILSNVTIKSLVDDVLTIEMRPMTNPTATTVIHEMKRVK